MWGDVGIMNSQDTDNRPGSSDYHGDNGACGTFVNHYLHRLDAKRRLTIPSEWRDLAGYPARLYVLPGVSDRCLTVLPAREMMRRLNESRKRLKLSDPKARQFNRVLASHADSVTWDKVGRIRIKDSLLDYAGIKNHAMLVGAFEGFELWEPEAWKKSGALEQVQFAEFAEYVGL